MHAGAKTKRKNRYHCFAEHDARLIAKKAGQLVRCAGLSPGDFDDLQQDLALDLWRRKKKYDPHKARPNTFASQVLRNGAATILASRRAACRDHRLEEELPDESNDEGLKTGTLGPNEAILATAALSEWLARAADVAKAKSKLTGAHQELCALLSEATISDVATELGLARSTLYGVIGDVRRQFDREGLRAYLPDTFPSSPVGTRRAGRSRRRR